MEELWGWMRKSLHKMGLADPRAGHVAPEQTAYKARVQRLMTSPFALQGAKRFYTIKLFCGPGRGLLLQRTLLVKATLVALGYKSCLSSLSS